MFFKKYKELKEKCEVLENRCKELQEYQDSNEMFRAICNQMVRDHVISSKMYHNYIAEARMCTDHRWDCFPYNVFKYQYIDQDMPKGGE